MTDDGVGTGRDDLLILRYLNGRRAVSVFPENEVENEIGDNDEQIAKDHRGRWDMRPSEAMVDCWQDESCRKREHRKRHDDLLRFLPFSCRPHLHAAFKELGVVD